MLFSQGGRDDEGTCLAREMSTKEPRTDCVIGGRSIPGTNQRCELSLGQCLVEAFRKRASGANGRQPQGKFVLYTCPMSFLAGPGGCPSHFCSTGDALRVQNRPGVCRTSDFHYSIVMHVSPWLDDNKMSGYVQRRAVRLRCTSTRSLLGLTLVTFCNPSSLCRVQIEPSLHLPNSRFLAAFQNHLIKSICICVCMSHSLLSSPIKDTRQNDPSSFRFNHLSPAYHTS